MVAPASTLSHPDQELLTAFIAVRFNLIELARHTKRPLLSLQDWALEPLIQHHIARYRMLEKLQHETETSDARSAGIAALLDILGQSEDPIERRRAAQTLIRVGSAEPEGAPRRPSHTPRPHEPHEPNDPLDPLDHADRADQAQEFDDHASDDAGLDLDPNADPDADLDEDIEPDIEDDQDANTCAQPVPRSHPSCPTPPALPAPGHDLAPGHATLNAAAHDHSGP